MEGIDVLIPVFRPGKEFGMLLKKLQEQTVAPRHIYLLQTLEDGVEPMKTDSRVISVHPVKKSEFDHGGTRRFGAAMSEGGFMLFMTQDAMPYDDRLIEKLLAAFEDEKVAVAYGRQLAREGADEIEQMTRLHNYPKESIVKSKDDLARLGIKTYFCSDVCAMYRKSVYDKLGGFVRKAIFNEDMIMAANVINAGYKVAYQADAKVIHSHSYTCMQQFHRNFDLGVSQSSHPEIFADISSEKEGAGYASSLIKALLRRGKIFKAFYFAMQCGFKLTGYKMGRHHNKLPRRVVMWCTMSPWYWK